jgi:hypothetical protein
MQTIARANRVMPGKEAGLIIDYVGVFKSLQKALAIYAPRPGEDGDEPIKDKTELVEALGQAIEQLVGWCEERGVDPNAIKTATGFDRVKLLDDAVEAIPEDDETKKAFLQHMQFGWFYGGHRALADCEACLALLAQSLPKSGASFPFGRAVVALTVDDGHRAPTTTAFRQAGQQTLLGLAFVTALRGVTCLDRLDLRPGIVIDDA